MAKKSKRNIKALIAKRAELHSANQKPALAIPGAPKTAPKSSEELLLPDTSHPVALPAHHSTEIWRTLIATAVIAVVLTGTIIVDRQKPFLDTFGEKLYNALELGN